MSIQQMTQRARSAARFMSTMQTQEKNRALEVIAQALAEKADQIAAANRQDLLRSEKQGLAQPLIQRLNFDQDKIKEVIDGIEDLVKLNDPVGQTLLARQLDDGLDLYRVSCPIGVIGVIFESRPDALVQISSLCLKSGNAVILKGGSEAQSTNSALFEVINEAGSKAGLPEGWINLLSTRTDVKDLLECHGTVDLLIPRGSNEFVQYIMEHTNIPVLGHADGVCHLYIDAEADLAMALAITLDSKTQYVAVCNAVETLLVDRSKAGEFLPQVADALGERGVEIFGCQETCRLIGCQPVTDWHREYLDYKISVKVVGSAKEAIAHINRYSSHHTDAIVTESAQTARRFLQAVDSGNVFWNCSTRFSDGFRYGFGAEVGISTSKIHARGPVGIEGLVTYQYRMLGQGQLVGPYAAGKSKFKHRDLNKKY